MEQQKELENTLNPTQEQIESALENKRKLNILLDSVIKMNLPPKPAHLVDPRPKEDLKVVDTEEKLIAPAGKITMKDRAYDGSISDEKGSAFEITQGSIPRGSLN